MSVRTTLLSALRRETLGPRYHCHESLSASEDPRNEFITGVLIPKSAMDADAKEIEDTAETLGESTGEFEDDDTDDEEIAIASPSLDPKSLPRSLGISFAIYSPLDKTPQIEVCATWARYLKEKSSSEGQDVFLRVPNCYVSPKPIDIDCGSKSIATIDEVYISCRIAKIAEYENAYKVSVYLVNDTSLPQSHDKDKPTRPETRDLIFQPQIRIISVGEAQLLAFDKFQPLDETPSAGSLAEEEESLALIYRQNQAYARGHLCAAIWKEIDPERPLNTEQDNPLLWSDGEIVESTYGNKAFNKFVSPDCRTEYIPCYPVQSPDINWREGVIDNIPNLNATELSEMWQASVFSHALRPITDGYLEWIKQQEQEVKNIDIKYHRAAQRHLQSCRNAARRIEEAINLIEQDEEVKLAFCFANRAIALQASWRRSDEFKWRPFQLAFLLMNLPAIANPLHEDRLTCDLLAFPTGGGKTEAYLGLAAFTLGLRRLRSEKDSHGHRTGHGISVISRYTLRLLTIQQFRRALGLIVACEILRVKHTGTSIPSGWRPKECKDKNDYIWGTTRFSAGLWVGGKVTPNSLTDYRWGAIKALKGEKAEGEPAQVLNCPCCNSILAIPKDGLGSGEHILHIIIDRQISLPTLQQSIPELEELEVLPTLTQYIRENDTNYMTLSLSLKVREGSRMITQKLDQWWDERIMPLLDNAKPAAFRISRPGYFPRRYRGRQGADKIENFEIHCPNPQCDLNTDKAWNEKVPLRFNSAYTSASNSPNFFTWEESLPTFRSNRNTPYSYSIPITAYTVDDQIYTRIPSLLVATVDKFARLSFEPRAGSIFGNIDSYHSRTGYFRYSSGNDTLSPKTHIKSVRRLLPPDLILQDELHLIEGPLGSMVGLYETAVEALCQSSNAGKISGPKYIASTATVRQSQTQIRCLFNRSTFQFPPPSLSASDNFFAVTPNNIHPVLVNQKGEHPQGRLYVAVCAPGKGAQTPIVRIYSALLQTIYSLHKSGYSANDCDPFWTLVGYFNAIRELAGALTLYRQDIPERIRHQATNRGQDQRPLEQEAIELSSRRDSTELPGLLSSLNKALSDVGQTTKDIVLSTSMFGTGVDIDRLGLMVVNGQPKTTASYIQATGRVGRKTGGMVVTFFRASRPRDLDHYEFFTGYHRAIYRYVEPITVTPFASRARERGIGPAAVAMLRQASELLQVPVPPDWVSRTGARYMQGARDANELDVVKEIILERSQTQVGTRRPPDDQVEREIRGGFDRWERAASTEPTLIYEEYAIDDIPRNPVVLGDEQHQKQGLTVVFRNAPSSLREVESMTRFGSIRKQQQD